MANKSYKMFEPCRSGDCDDCAGENQIIEGNEQIGVQRTVVICSCECHHPDWADSPDLDCYLLGQPDYESTHTVFGRRR